MFWHNKTLVKFDLIQHQISFAGSSDVRLSFSSLNITCPGKTNLMLDSVSSNKCLMWDMIVLAVILLESPSLSPFAVFVSVYSYWNSCS